MEESAEADSCFSPLVVVILSYIESTTIVFGNVILCWCFYSNKLLRTKQNYFVISLSVSDLLVGFAVPPCEYCAHSKGCYCSTFCKGLMNFTMFSSVMNLVLIASDRYFSIITPFKYDVFLTKLRARIIVAGGWLVTFLLMFTPLTWQLNTNLEKLYSKKITLNFTIIIFSIIIVILSTLFFAYIKIVFIIKEKLSGKKASNPGGIKACIMVSISFFVFWIPTCVVEIMLESDVLISSIASPIIFTVLLLNPCLDPFFYAYYRKDFRKEVAGLFKKFKKKTIDPITFIS